jgi:hypothetical protein
MPCGQLFFYVNFKEKNLEIDSLGCYMNHVDRLCNLVEVKKWTGRSQFRESITDRYRHLRNSEILLTDTAGRRYEDSRPRRWILNCVGEISKVLSDEKYADHYNEQIRRFQRNSDDNTKLLKQQFM